MGVVRITKLKPGAILGEDVKDVKGRLLLPRGKPIGPEHIRIFKIWGISQVEIMSAEEDAPRAPEAPVDPAKLKALRVQLEESFQHTDRRHPAMEELFNQALERRAAQSWRYGDEEPVEPLPSTDKPPPRERDFLQAFTEREITLPEIPSIVHELNEVISNPLSSSDQIAQVINKSPSLTALLLRIVNSSFYGLSARVDRVSLAVTLIGTRELSALALGISILSMFKKIPGRLLNMHSFLAHSLACAVSARLLTAQKNLRQTEQMFTAGLLHDLGRLLVYIYFPDEAIVLLRTAAQSRTCLYLEEHRRLGCHHGHIGKYLLNQWRLPLSLENAVSFHHEPSLAPDPEAAAIIHVADIIVNALGIGTSGERFVPPLDAKAWETLGLAPTCFELVINQLNHQMNALEFLLQP
jgi:HD-like signal output (HDOD) protein